MFVVRLWHVARVSNVLFVVGSCSLSYHAEPKTYFLKKWLGQILQKKYEKNQRRGGQLRLLATFLPGEHP